MPSSVSHSVILLLFFHSLFPRGAQLPSLYTLPPGNALSLLHLGLQKPQVAPHLSLNPLSCPGLTPASPSPSYTRNSNWAQHSQVVTRREESLSLLTTHFLVHPSWSWPSLKRHIQTLLTIPPSMSIQFFPATAFYPVSLCNCLVQDKYPILFY